MVSIPGGIIIFIVAAGAVRVVVGEGGGGVNKIGSSRSSSSRSIILRSRLLVGCSLPMQTAVVSCKLLDEAIGLIIAQ